MKPICNHLTYTAKKTYLAGEGKKQTEREETGSSLGHQVFEPNFRGGWPLRVRSEVVCNDPLLDTIN